MSTQLTTADAARLSRLLGFLARDHSNLRLLQEVLSLVIAYGDLHQAQQLAEHIEKHPIEDATVWAQMAHLQLLIRNFAAAGAYGSKAIQAGASHPAVLLNTAYGYFYSGHYDTCAAILAKLTVQDDASTDTLVLHARALHHLAMPERAESLVMRALQREPELLEAKGLMALLLHERGRNDTALHLAHEVLAQDPNQLDALLACSSVHVEQGNMEAARKAWRHTVTAHPTCGRAWSGLAQVEFHALEFADAEDHLKSAVTFMPDHIGTWHLLAWIYILRGDSTPARSALEQSYTLDRTFGETHGGLAIVDMLDGKLDDAQLGIRRALKLNPDGMSARYAQMLMLQKAGKLEEAQALVRQVLDRKNSGNSHSGRVLIEHWLQNHSGKSPRSSSGQH